MSTLTINMNETLKAKARKMAKEEGLTLTALITQLLKSYLRNECMFRMTPAAEKRMDDAIRESDEALANGTARLYSSAEEMTDDILSRTDEQDDIRDSNDSII